VRFEIPRKEIFADFKTTGVYAPGYQERRRERLLEKYGIDVGSKA
jgi:hypothetical protein